MYILYRPQYDILFSSSTNAHLISFIHTAFIPHHPRCPSSLIISSLQDHQTPEPIHILIHLQYITLSIHPRMLTLVVHTVFIPQHQRNPLLLYLLFNMLAFSLQDLRTPRTHPCIYPQYSTLSSSSTNAHPFRTYIRCPSKITFLLPHTL